MAQYGAHVTSVVNEIHAQPSIFEVVAQESLVSSIQPALKYALRVLANKDPARFGWLFSYSDELHMLMQSLLEYHFLKQHSSSFAEHFYGMKRTSYSSSSAPLPTTTRLRSLLFIVLVPYAKRQCDKLYESSQHVEGERCSKLLALFTSFYPTLHMAWHGITLLFQMAYMFHNSCHHSPWLWLAGVTLAYRDAADEERTDMSPLTLSNWPGRLFGSLASGVSRGLTVFVFLLQFLQWWYSDDRGRVTPLTALPVPPPPEPSGALKWITPGRCPLCNELTTNQTVLPASGFVFCYPCIFNYVTKTGRCPISRYPVSVASLIRLHT